MSKTAADKEYENLFGLTDTPVKQRGHAAFPGSGPDGEKCKTCKHIFHHAMAKTYLKCDLIKWTHGSATDIRANDPACDKWEAKDE